MSSRGETPLAGVPGDAGGAPRGPGAAPIAQGPGETGAALVKAARAALAELADPVKAPQMQAYMKSALPFLGVLAPARRSALKRVFAEHRLGSPADWRETVLALWREAEFREERYGAIELSGYHYYRPFQTLDALPMYEEMIVSGAWWDYVDDIAIHRIGPLLAAHPQAMRPRMLEWATDGDLWKRRTAILCQVSFKERTDLGLLYACIRPSLSDGDFFARKAIGWALRAYSAVDPGEVVRYVEATGITGLGRREALRNIDGIGR
jgi:3-methyladenine DNA glycosylase AlkD